MLKYNEQDHLIMLTHIIVSLLNASGVVHVITHFGKILITITNSMVRSP